MASQRWDELVVYAHMKMTYDELKLSPLGKQDAVPEEVAIWLGMRSLCSASGMMNIFKLIEQNYQAGIVDFFDYDYSKKPFRKLSVDMSAGYASSIILKNLFAALFVCKCIGKKDFKRLLKFANAKIESIRKKLKASYTVEWHIATNLWHDHLDKNSKILENLLEVYAELAERLQNALEDMQDDAR